MEVTLESLSKQLQDSNERQAIMTKHMVTLAERVYKHGDGMGEEPMMPGAGGGQEEMYPMDSHDEMPQAPMQPEMPGAGGPGMPGAPMDPAGGYDENNYGRKGYRMSREVYKFLQEKGFTGDYETAADEEGGKWDEKDSDVRGLEAQPAGQQGGEREDETFGPGGMSYQKSLEKRLRELEQGVTIAKAEVPAGGFPVDKAKIGGQSESVTREQQMQAVKTPWSELCKFAEANGYFADMQLG